MQNIIKLDKDTHIVSWLDESVVIEANVTMTINEASQLVLKLPETSPLEPNVRYIATTHPNNPDKFLLFVVSRMQTDDSGVITYTCNDLLFDNLKYGNTIPDKRYYNRPVTQALNGIASQYYGDYKWNFTTNLTGSVNLNFYYIQTLEALFKIIEQKGGELELNVDIDGNKVSAFNVNINRATGSDKGAWFEYGDKLLKVEGDTDFSNIITLIYPRGKGEEIVNDTGKQPETPEGYGRRLTINGQPVNEYHPTKDKEWVFDEKANDEWHNLGEQYNRREVTIIYEDETDPARLMERAIADLKRLNHPQVSYSVNVIEAGNLSLGDTVRIIYHKGGVAYKDRVYSVEYNLVHPELNTAHIGTNMENRSVDAQIGSVANSVASATNQIANIYQNPTGSKTGYGALPEPEGFRKGDVWFKTNTDGTTEMYYHDGKAWVLSASTDKNDTSLSARVSGDSNVYYGDKFEGGATYPPHPNVGDTWFRYTGDNYNLTNMYRYKGGTVGDNGWVKFNGAYDASGLTSGVVDGTVVGLTNLDADEIKKGVLDANSVPVVNIDASKITKGMIDGEVVPVENLNADKIVKGSIDAGKINVNNINAGNITSGHLLSNIVEAIRIDAEQIVAGTIDASKINVVNLKASNITTGKLNAEIVKAIEINASQIVAGTIDARQIGVTHINASNITSGTIDANKIFVRNLSASDIVVGYMSADHILGGTIDASYVNVINLSANSITTGTLDGNKVHIGNGKNNLFINGDGITVATTNTYDGTLQPVSQIQTLTRELYLGTNKGYSTTYGNISLQGVQYLNGKPVPSKNWSEIMNVGYLTRNSVVQPWATGMYFNPDMVEGIGMGRRDKNNPDFGIDKEGNAEMMGNLGIDGQLNVRGWGIKTARIWGGDNLPSIGVGSAFIDKTERPALSMSGDNNISLVFGPGAIYAARNGVYKLIVSI